MTLRCIRDLCLMFYADKVCLKFAQDLTEGNMFCTSLKKGDRSELLYVKGVVKEVQELMELLRRYIDCLLDSNPEDYCLGLIGHE